MGAQLEHRGVRAVQHLVEHAPASGALALWARHVDLDEKQVRAAAGIRTGSRGTASAAGADDPAEGAAVTTDGTTLFYAPGFAALTLPEQGKTAITVTDAPDGVKGDSANNVYKAVTCETGLVVQVPLFIVTGEKISVKTEDGSYLGRA